MQLYSPYLLKSDPHHASVEGLPLHHTPILLRCEEACPRPYCEKRIQLNSFALKKQK